MSCQLHPAPGFQFLLLHCASEHPNSGPRPLGPVFPMVPHSDTDCCWVPSSPVLSFPPSHRVHTDGHCLSMHLYASMQQGGVSSKPGVLRAQYDLHRSNVWEIC